LDKPHILDVGCGSGVQKFELARLSKGTVGGIDFDQCLINKLNSKIDREDLSNRVKTKKCLMLNLNFADERFDVIWTEAVIKAIGLENGLKDWGRMLKPKSFFVVYDEIKTLLIELKNPNLGYKRVNHFFA
jgi:ubiquinone/menaquinone biosynthesis C-methylase UbiE